MQHICLSLPTGSRPEGKLLGAQRPPMDSARLRRASCLLWAPSVCPHPPIPSAPCSSPLPVRPPGARWVRTAELAGLRVETWLTPRSGQAASCKAGDHQVCAVSVGQVSVPGPACLTGPGLCRHQRRVCGPCPEWQVTCSPEGRGGQSLQVLAWGLPEPLSQASMGRGVPSL